MIRQMCGFTLKEMNKSTELRHCTRLEQVSLTTKSGRFLSFFLFLSFLSIIPCVMKMLMRCFQAGLSLTACTQRTLSGACQADVAVSARSRHADLSIAVYSVYCFLKIQLFWFNVLFHIVHPILWVVTSTSNLIYMATNCHCW